MLLRALENEEGMNFFELLYVFRNYFLDQSFYAMCHRPKSISIFQHIALKWMVQHFLIKC